MRNASGGIPFSGADLARPSSRRCRKDSICGSRSRSFPACAVSFVRLVNDASISDSTHSASWQASRNGYPLNPTSSTSQWKRMFKRSYSWMVCSTFRWICPSCSRVFLCGRFPWTRIRQSNARRGSLARFPVSLSNSSAYPRSNSSSRILSAIQTQQFAGSICMSNG